MLIDTHAHIYDEYYSDTNGLINNCLENNILKIINCGVDDKTNKEVIAKLNIDILYGALGIHPENITNYSESDIRFIENNIYLSKIVAIGEIGLDYHYTKENKKEQIILFEKQLKLAEENNMPVIIHSRDATEDTLNILKKYNVKGIIHSFSGSLEIANEYIKMGYLLGINGVITFKNCNLKDVLEKIDISNIVLETDSPYLTPVPFRGKQNTPVYIKNTADFVANIYNISVDELVNKTNENLCKIFAKIHN